MLIKATFSSFKNLSQFAVHGIILYFLVKRLRLFFKECVQTFMKNYIRLNPTVMINLCSQYISSNFNNIGILDIYFYYSKMLKSKRKRVIHFLQKNKEV